MVGGGLRWQSGSVSTGVLALEMTENNEKFVIITAWSIDRAWGLESAVKYVEICAYKTQ
jgi:hypothetical protein